MYYSEMKKRKIFRASNFCIVFLIAFSLILPPQAQAARRRAGGGEIAKFNFGNYAAGIGIGIGAMAVGGVINAGLTSAMGKGIQAAGGTVPRAMAEATKAGIPGAMWNSLSYSFTSTGLITNMSTFMAVSQVGRAVGAAGSYYGWKPSTTFLVSSGISAAVGGFMNPSVALGPSVSEGITNSIIPGIHYTLNPANFTLSNMLSGAFVGGVTGLASGAVIVAIDGNKINKGKEPGVGAQIAGMVTGVAVGNLTRALIDPAIYTQGPETTWERVNNPEIKNTQDLAKTKTVTADVVAKAKGVYGGAKELLTGGTWQDAKQVYYEGITKAEESGFVKNMRTSAQADVQKANKLASSDSGRYRYQHVFDANVREGFVQPNKYVDLPDGTRTPAKGSFRYEMDAAGKVPRLYAPNEVMAKGRSYKVTPLPGKDFVSVAETGIKAPISLVGQRLFEATFINTLDMWPQLVTNSLVIAATSSLGKKQKWMAPLVSAVVSGVTGPLLSNLADVYALRPGIYIGEHHIAKSLGNIELVKGLGLKERMGGVADDVYAKVDSYLKTHETAAKQDAASLKAFTQGLQGVLQDHHSKVKLSDTSVEALLAEGLKKGIISQEDADRMLNTYRENVKTPAGQVIGLALGAANLETQEIMLNKSVNQGLRDLRTSRFQLFATNATRDMTYGLVEGVVSGGIQSLASKVSEKSPFAAVGIAYGANMLSAAVRGVIWRATWTPSKNVFEDVIWLPKWSLPKPEKYGIEPGQDDRVWQALNDYTYPRELKKVEEFRVLTGLSPVNRTKEIFERTAEGVVKTKEKEVQMYELTLGLEEKKIALKSSTQEIQVDIVIDELEEKLGFRPEVTKGPEQTVISVIDYRNVLDDQKLSRLPGVEQITNTEIRPSLGVAVLSSLAQANRQFLTESFSFGTPPMKPENMTSLNLTNYLNNMRGYAMTAMSADLRYIPSTRKEESKNIGFHQSMDSFKEKLGSIKKLLGGHPKKAIDQFYSKKPKEKQPLTGWLTPGIVSGYIGADSTTISTNILTTMGAIRPLADTLNIQHQRLVLTNSAIVPVTVQNLDYEPWLAARKTSFYAPFPSDSFGARNKKGKTFLPGR